MNTMSKSTLCFQRLPELNSPHGKRIQISYVSKKSAITQQVCFSSQKKIEVRVIISIFQEQILTKVGGGTSDFNQKSDKKCKKNCKKHVESSKLTEL